MLLDLFDITAIFLGAISGGLTAVRAQFNVFGVLVLATVTGLGGGTLRDLLIGVAPPLSLTDWRYLVAALAAGIATFFFHPEFGRVERPMNVFDAFGLGLFSVAGALKAVDHGLPPLAAVLLGVITGVGGGMLRDTLIGRVPLILRKGELYATPAALGAGLTVLGLRMGMPQPPVLVVAAVACIGWRLLAMWHGWTAPEPRFRDR